MKTYSFTEAAIMIGCFNGTLDGWQRRPDWPLPERKRGANKNVRYTLDEIKAVRAWNPTHRDLGPEFYWDE